MSDFYYTNDVRTETDGRGDIENVAGDEQLEQQVATVAGNVMVAQFAGGGVTAEDIEEFTGTVSDELQSIGDVGRVLDVTVERLTPTSEQLTVSIDTSLVSTSETFELPQ